MKKFLLIISFLVIVGQAKTQVVNLFNGFDLSVVQPRDSLAFEIKNTGTGPVTFYPLTVFDSPGNYLFLSEENYYSYLRLAGTQIDALLAHARITKSPFFFNGNRPVDELGEGFYQKEIAEKKYAFPQWFLTSCHYLCGEFNIMSDIVLTKSQIFEEDSIWDLNLSGHHSLGEGIVKGDTLLIDFDPSMPRFLDTLPDGTYMNAADVSLHPEYFNQQEQYKICNETDSCWANDDRSNDSYAGFFQDINGFARAPINELDPQNMSGAWTLCSGCSFVFEWKVPSVVDTNDFYTWLLADSLTAVLENQPLDMVALGHITQRLFGTSSGNEGIDVFNKGNYIFPGELSNPYKTSAYLYNSTTVKLKIPGRVNGYAADDIQLPLAVHKIISENGLSIGGNSISPGSHEFKLWTEAGVLEPGDDILTINPDSFNHLRDVSIPANNPVEIELYYNQLLYKFLNGFKAELFSGTPNLTVSAYPDAVSGQEAKIRARNTVFPNPTSDKLWVSYSGILTDAAGKPVMRLEAGINNVEGLASGIYFLQCMERETQKIIKY